MNYEQLAKKLVARAVKMGAQQAEAFIEVGRQSSCRVRDGEIEDLTQATSKGVGVRVISRGRLGFAYTSDFEPGSLEGFVDRALQLAEAAAPNKLNGLPGKAELAGRARLGKLFDPEVANLPPEWKIRTALAMEKAARAVDPRITAFDGVGAGDYVSEVFVASSEGLVDGYDGTYVFLFASPVAREADSQQTSYWMDTKRFLGELDSPESVGQEAGRLLIRIIEGEPGESVELTNPSVIVDRGSVGPPP